MLVMLGFSSEFSIIEAIFVAIMDEFPGVLRANKWRPIMFRGICCLLFFCVTIPMITNGGFYLFTLVDSAAAGFPLLIIGAFEIIAVNWAYGFNRFSDDIVMMIGRRPNIYFRVTWVAAVPVILTAITGFKAYQHAPLTLGRDTGTGEAVYHYPDWAEALYWVIVSSTVIWIPVIAMYMICSRGGWQVIKQVTGPRKRWGPALPENRTGIYAKSKPKKQPVMQEKQPLPHINGNAHDNVAFIGSNAEISTEL